MCLLHFITVWKIELYYKIHLQQDAEEYKHTYKMFPAMYYFHLIFLWLRPAPDTANRH